MPNAAGLRADKLALLQEELVRLAQAAEHLRWSLARCQPLAALPHWDAEALERLESLASRFARLADLLTQRIMRLADALELESPGTLLDRVRRAEKRGWVQQDGQLVRARELRNLIAHEYEDQDLAALYQAVIVLAPVLLQAAQAAADWAAQVY
jgi:hypothetical protein